MRLCERPPKFPPDWLLLLLFAKIYIYSSQPSFLPVRRNQWRVNVNHGAQQRRFDADRHTHKWIRISKIPPGRTRQGQTFSSPFEAAARSMLRYFSSSSSSSSFCYYSPPTTVVLTSLRYCTGLLYISRSWRWASPRAKILAFSIPTLVYNYTLNFDCRLWILYAHNAAGP